MAETYRVYWGADPGNLTLIEGGISELEIPMPIEGILDYYTSYYWRVDATNEYGTTEGDVWGFTTIRFRPPVSYGGIDEDGDGYGDGTGYDLATQKRLVCAAGDTFFYEDI